MLVGTSLVLLGTVGLAPSVQPPGRRRTPVGGVPGSDVRPRRAGMGFAYPRTGVAMLEASTDRDRGFNSSALSVADSLGAALSLSVGAVFAASNARTSTRSSPSS